jgi:hypothetical protein
VRHPLEVACSLALRHGLSIAHGTSLYNLHWHALLPQLRNLPAAFLEFDDLCAAPADAIRAAAGKLRIDLMADSTTGSTACAGPQAQPNLRHHHFSKDPSACAFGLPPRTLDLYKALVRAARIQDAPPPPPGSASPCPWWEDVSPVLRDLDHLSEQMSSTCGGLRQPEGTPLTWDDQEQIRLQDELAFRDRTIARKADEIARKNQQIADRDGQIAALRTSTSWKLTAPLRALAMALDRMKRRLGTMRGGGWRNLTHRPRADAPGPALDDYLPSTSSPWPVRTGLGVAVIIPVYRGLQETRRCLESVLAHDDDLPAEIVVIDDGSPDPRIREMVDALSAAGRITLLRNRRNSGFVSSVNMGMNHAAVSRVTRTRGSVSER